MLSNVAEPLRLASEALREKSRDILEQHGFSVSDLLIMQFPTSDEFYCVTGIRLETQDGKVFEKSSSSLG